MKVLDLKNNINPPESKFYSASIEDYYRRLAPIKVATMSSIVYAYLSHCETSLSAEYAVATDATTII